MQKVDLTVRRLIEMMTQGELLLPELQRKYVWRATRVRDLLDSLYRGYPSGAILVWETDEPVPVRNAAVQQGASPFGVRKLLLDGQQRLTSLTAAIQGKPIEVRHRKRPIEILFNLDHPEGIDEVLEVEDDDAEDDDRDVQHEVDEAADPTLQERIRKLTFVVSSRALAAMPNWVPVAKAMRQENDAEIYQRLGMSGFADPRLQKYAARLQRLRAIQDYPYVMHLLDRSLSYEEVAEIFVRVNSLGMKLRSSDLALAQITSRWRKLLPVLEEFQEECEEAGFTLDQGLLVRSMVVFASGQSRFKRVPNLSLESLQDGWKRAQDGLRFAMNFLRTNGGIEDETLLSSPAFLVLVAYLFEHNGGKLTPDEERVLLEWVLVGSARGYFSASLETKLDADLSRVRAGAGPLGLLKNLEQLFGRLRFDAADLEGRTDASGLYALVFLALKRRGAKDWKTGLGISLLHKGRQHLIQSHHIFPKARLKGRYERRQVNEIANMAFIGGTTNRRISASNPTDYLPKVIEDRGEEALRSQCVPLDPAMWEVDRFEDFLAWRRAALAEAVNHHLDGL